MLTRSSIHFLIMHVSLPPTLLKKSVPTLLVCLAFTLPAVGDAAKKEKNFLDMYPQIFKFCLFWWCFFVFVVMAIYIIDSLLTKYSGPALVNWKVDHTFRGVDDRQAYWAQLADPSSWSPEHPVLASADIRMVSIAKTDKDAAKVDKEDADTDDATSNANAADSDAARKPSVQVKPIELQRLKVGLGMMLRHKVGDNAGSLFCTRACTALDEGEETWRMTMETVECGAGYPFLEGSEESVVEMHLPQDDGTMLCTMSGCAAVSSRFFRWWSGLRSASEVAAISTLDAIDENMQRAKKQS